VTRTVRGEGSVPAEFSDSAACTDPRGTADARPRLMSIITTRRRLVASWMHSHPPATTGSQTPHLQEQ